MVGRPRSVSDQEIFAAVAAVVTEVGPSGLTLAAVAERAGLTAPALTQRFGSKHGLLVAFATSEAESLSDIFARNRAAHADPLTTLIATLSQLPSAITTSEGLANNLAFFQMDLIEPELRTHAVSQSRAMRAEIAKLVTEAMQTGLISINSAETLAADVYATYCGSMLTWAIDGKGTLPDWIATHLGRTLMPYRSASRGRKRK